MERMCINCEHALVSGKYIPATHWQPAEHPEVDGCRLEEKDDVTAEFDLYKEMWKSIEKHEKKKPDVPGWTSRNDFGRYCPMFEQRRGD